MRLTSTIRRRGAQLVSSIFGGRCAQVGGIVVAAAILCLPIAINAQPADLEAGFASPPPEAKPWVYWFWMNGNITEEGITADLEAMDNVGIGGVLIMSVSNGIPPGPVDFMSPKWRELFAHAVRQADRLGIQVTMNNDDGWTGSGGPWITPRQSMQQLTWSETTVTGPDEFDGELPQPRSRRDYYRDVALFALPAPPGGDRSSQARQPTVTCSRQGLDASVFADGDPNTTGALSARPTDQTQQIVLQFETPVQARSMTIMSGPGRNLHGGVLQVSDDGEDFRDVRQFRLPHGGGVAVPYTVTFSVVSGRYYRLLFNRMHPSYPWIRIAEISLNQGSRIDRVGAKAGFYRASGLQPVGGDYGQAETALESSRIIDLSSHLGPDSHLTWTIPEGHWTLLRIGHTTTGKTNHPATPDGTGLECSKLSKDAIRAHFDGFLGKLIADVGPLAGRTLRYTHVDSWEVGAQTWEPGFRGEFRKRCGYDPMPYLPAVTGRIVESLEVSERFLWDLRRTYADVLADSYLGELRKLAHAHGMGLSVEAYGQGVFDNIQCAGRTDIPMSEFWTGSAPRVTGAKQASSAAHTYGRRIVAAESFTANPEHGRWTNHPYSMKVLGDTIYTGGVNRFVFHRYAHQPWMDRLPGMTFGPHGIHYERTNTWWEQSRAWIDYLSRCQYLLQRGLFVADVLIFGGEEAPNGYPGHLATRVPDGFDCDTCTRETLLELTTVEDGRLVVAPDPLTGAEALGPMSYRVLLLPDSRLMTPELAAKVRDLVRAGAHVIAPKPIASPSLREHPDCDQRVRDIADEVWGNCDGETMTEQDYRRGTVYWGRSLEQILTDTGIRPDVDIRAETANASIGWIHRRTGGADLYFMANGRHRIERTVCTFRAGGRAPELWHPDTGRIERPAVYEVHEDGRVAVPLRFGPAESVFVVFRAEPDVESITSVARDGETLLDTKPPEPARAPDNNRNVADNFTMAAWVLPSRDIPLPEETNEGITWSGQDWALYPPPGHEVYEEESQAGAGAAVGRNGICVFEHSGGYAASVLVHPAKITDWTHITIVYRDGTPHLYLNGRFADKGLRGPHRVHSGVNVQHDRRVAPYSGRIGEWVQFDRALAESEVADLAEGEPPAADGRWPLPPIELTRDADGDFTAMVSEAGQYTLQSAQDRQQVVEVDAVPDLLPVSGPWELSFPAGWGAPESVMLQELISWPEHSDPGIRYFSGTATYTKTFDLPADRLEADGALLLDLGRVAVIAEVALNGRPLGILWKPPFRIEITDAAKPGGNRLQVRVTNLWPNRLIGDEQYPPYLGWRGNGSPAEWPEWVYAGGPVPETGRETFTTWHHFNEDSPLLESGLLGPVRILSAVRIHVP